MREVTVRTQPPGKHTQTIQVGPNTLIADEPIEAGGNDLGPAPHELLLSALGACTSMTLKMYADRKGWPLTAVDVKLTGEKVAVETGGQRYVIKRVVTLSGELSAEQREGLLAIANKCPVHKTLTNPISIESSLNS